ncbi:MAG: hypothetical protein ACI4JR_05760, partial [Acutalibacteraceae bacterium]
LTKFAGAIAMFVIGLGIKVAKLPSITQTWDDEAGVFVYSFVNASGTAITTQALDVLRIFMFLVPIPFCIAGYIIYKKKYWLYGEKYDKIKAQIDERRKAEKA